MHLVHFYIFIGFKSQQSDDSLKNHCSYDHLYYFHAVGFFPLFFLLCDQVIIQVALITDQLTFTVSTVNSTSEY